VDVLDGDRDGERSPRFCPDEVAGRERHQRSEALSPRKGGLFDGLAQPARAPPGRGELAGKRRFEPGAGCRGELVECSPVRECGGAACDRGPD
jgi:hypothetical protein